MFSIWAETFKSATGFPTPTKASDAHADRPAAGLPPRQNAHTDPTLNAARSQHAPRPAVLRVVR